MKTHDEIMAISTEARRQAAKESSTWAEGTQYTDENLESMYEGYVVRELEAGRDDYWDFTGWCEYEMKIPNETPTPSED